MGVVAMPVLSFLLRLCFPPHGDAYGGRGLLSSTSSAYIFVFKQKVASAALQTNWNKQCASRGSSRLTDMIKCRTGWIGRRLQTSLQRTADRT